MGCVWCVYASGFGEEWGAWVLTGSRGKCLDHTEEEFVPREIHLVSEEGLFVAGNGLLYRYDQ